MEKKLATIREAVEKDRSTFNLCKDYIQTAPKKDSEEFEVRMNMV